jgi:hypothetical protein
LKKHQKNLDFIVVLCYNTECKSILDFKCSDEDSFVQIPFTERAPTAERRTLVEQNAFPFGADFLKIE